MKVFCSILAATIFVMQMPIQWEKGVLLVSASGTENAAVETPGDEWADVQKESEEGKFSREVDEFGCRLKPWHTCYKYEYAYRTEDTSDLEGEELTFYEG